PLSSPLLPYTTLFRSARAGADRVLAGHLPGRRRPRAGHGGRADVRPLPGAGLRVAALAQLLRRRPLRRPGADGRAVAAGPLGLRSEEHTSELQSLAYL